LGFTGKTEIIIDLILKMNRDDIENIYPKKIMNENFSREKDILSFFIDFETINKELVMGSLNSCKEFISIIGIGYSINNIWHYEKLYAINLDESVQISLIKDFFNIIIKISKKYNYNYSEVKLYHWSPYEKIILNKLCNYFNLELLIFNWFDLADLFKIEPIIIKGALNFSLKTIGKAMYKNNMIDVIWDNNDCSNGTDAIVSAYEIYKSSESIYNMDKKEINTEENIYLTETNDTIKKLNKLIHYNEIDCKIMWSILNYLQSNC